MQRPEKGLTITRVRGSHSAATLRQLAELDDGPELDKAFFAQHPERSYRARLATAGELARLRLARAMPPLVRADMFVFTCVRQLVPGMRQRHYRAAFVPPAMLHAGIPEHIARYMFLEE